MQQRQQTKQKQRFLQRLHSTKKARKRMMAMLAN
jgi:hypothetical protein